MADHQDADSAPSRAGVDPLALADLPSARGLRSCYPPGLPVAIVSSVGQSTDDLHKELQAQPIAALGRVDRVYVLTGGAK